MFLLWSSFSEIIPLKYQVFMKSIVIKGIISKNSYIFNISDNALAKS